jgi:hypothetical protein
VDGNGIELACDRTPEVWARVLTAMRERDVATLRESNRPLDVASLVGELGEQAVATYLPRLRPAR